MNLKKNNPTAPRLDRNLEDDHTANGANGSEGNENYPLIEETIAKNKEIIEKNRKFLDK